MSRKVGYRGNGRHRSRRRQGELAVRQALVLTPECFERGDVVIEVEGAAPLRRFVGLDADA